MLLIKEHSMFFERHTLQGSFYWRGGGGTFSQRLGFSSPPKEFSPNNKNGVVFSNKWAFSFKDRVFQQYIYHIYR